MNGIKLSTCMVLKDEGPTIYRCLESVAHVTDEFIIGIDKTTSDNTREEVDRFLSHGPAIAGGPEIGGKTITHFDDEEGKSSIYYKEDHRVAVVYEYDWPESFSKARNIGMDKANGDWLLIIDGHEYFPDEWLLNEEKRIVQPKLLLGEIKKRLGTDQLNEENTDEIFFNLYQQPFKGQVPSNQFLQPRIYRNGFSKKKGCEDKMLRYNRAAHNTIQNTRDGCQVPYHEIILIHDAPEENRELRKKQRQEMNIKQLMGDLEKNPNDTRAMFYLGNTYLEGKKFQEGIDVYLKYLEKTKNWESEEIYQCYVHLGLAYLQLKEKQKAKEALYQAMRVDNNRRDAHIIAGDYHMSEDEYDQALMHYKTAILIEPRPSRMFQNGGSMTWLPHQQIATAYAAKGDLANAISHLKTACAYVEHPGWLEQIRLWQNQRKGVLIIDSIGSFTLELEKELKDRKYEVVRLKEWNDSLAQWADFIFCEWMDHNAARIEKFAFKTVLRIHGYEAYGNPQLINNIPVDNMKGIIFVAEHIKEMLLPGDRPNVHVIQNGVNLEKFFIKNKERDPKNIGITGFLNVKKDPMELAKFIIQHPEMNFHLRIDWQDPYLKDAFEYQIQDCKNIIHHGRYDDLNEFWNQMSYCLSTSIIESFSFNIAEGMAAGCSPIIRPWKGAETIWQDFVAYPAIKSYKPRTVRRFIENNYPLHKSLNTMIDVMIGDKESKEYKELITTRAKELEENKKFYDEHWTKIINNLPSGGAYDYPSRSHCYNIVIDTLKEKDKIFDFGCGIGVFCREAMTKKEAKVSGCDVSKVAIDYCKGTIKGDYRITEEIFGYKYDAIVALYFLEHIKNPKDWLKSALQKSNRVICAIPNDFNRKGEHSDMQWQDWDSFNDLFVNFKMKRLDVDEKGKSLYPDSIAPAFKHPIIEFGLKE